MIGREEAEAFIKAAELELGPSSSDEWAEECTRVLRSAVTGVSPKRERPPEYYQQEKHMTTEVMLSEVSEAIKEMQKDPDAEVRAVAKLALPACEALRLNGVHTIEVEDESDGSEVDDDELEEDEDLEGLDEDESDEDDDESDSD